MSLHSVDIMGWRPRIASFRTYIRELNWRRHLAFIIILTALTAVLFLGYLSGPLPTGTDSEGLVMTWDMGLSSGGLFSSWEPYSALGFQNDPIPLPSAMFALASWMGLSASTTCKLIMAGSFWLAGAAMYLCALKISRSRLASSIAAIVFCFNQVFLSQIMEGHYFFAIGFALLPAAFLTLYLTIVEENCWAILALPMIFFAYGGSSAPHMILILSIFIVVMSILYFIQDRTRLHRIAYPSIALVLLVIPTALSRFSSGTGILNASYRLSEAQFWSYRDIFSALALRSTENSHMRGGTVQSWAIVDGLDDVMMVLSFVIPIMAVLSLYFLELRRLKLALAGTGLVMLFFALGPNQPLSGLFVWMFQNIPLLDSIRVFSRFGMFIGLVYALLVALLIAELQKRPLINLSIPHLPRLQVKRSDKLLAATVVVVMLASSSSVFIQGPSSFSLPESYAEPFELISSIEGDYRILTLPYGDVYYDTALGKYDGYPLTLTNDPGSYSQMVTGKEVAYGDHSEDYWAVWGSMVSEHKYGYRYLPILLGDTASVRYVVGQIHAPSGEVSDFRNMTGLRQYVVLSRSSTIMVNDHYSERVHAAGSLTLTTGGRADILTSLATGVVHLEDSDIVLLGQIEDSYDLQALWATSPHVIVQGGDLLQLLVENGAFSGDQLMRLGEYAEDTIDDSSDYWITSSEFVRDGSLLHDSAYTVGENVMEVPLTTAGAGSYDVYLRHRTGPGSGNLSVTVDDKAAITVPTYSPLSKETWTKVGTYYLESSETLVKIWGDGSGWCSVDDLLVVPAGDVDRKTSEVSEHLKNNSSSVTYLYGPDDLATDRGQDWEQVDGTEGWGLSHNGSEDPSLVVKALIPFDGLWTITLRTMNGSSAPSAIIEDIAVNGTDLDDGSYVFEANLSKGLRTIELRTSSAYSVTIESDGSDTEYGLAGAVVTYERKSPWSYEVNVNTTTPTFLKLSESFSEQWTAHDGSGTLLHYQSGSQVNGYYLPSAGNYSITIDYAWQERYQTNLVIFIAATLMATLGLAAALWWKKGRNDTRQ